MLVTAEKKRDLCAFDNVLLEQNILKEKTPRFLEFPGGKRKDIEVPAD